MPGKTLARMLALALPLVLPLAPALAGTPAGASDLRALAQQYLQAQTRGLGERVTVEVEPPRAHFGDCANPKPFLPGNGARRWGKVSVGLRCAGGGVRYLQARVNVQVRYWESAHDVPRGAPVTVAHLKARQGDLGKLPRNVVRDLAALEGSVARRPLPAGTVLQHSLITRPALVERQQWVTVATGGAGFQIARRARALDSGGRGDAIRVRLQSREILNAEVTGPGEARLAP